MKPVLSFTIVGLTATALLGAGCTPRKEDTPPSPKVSVSDASAAAANGATGMLMAQQKPEPPGGLASTAPELPVLGPAPKWELRDLKGNLVSSEQLKGKVVVVDFWATWCGPCRIEIPGYIDMQNKLGKDGLVVVGVSLDQGGPGVVQRFADTFGINYPLVMGDEDVVEAFGGIEGIPTTFLIDREGRIRDRKVGVEEAASYEKKVRALLPQT